MRNNVKGIIIGSAGAVFLSIVSAALYDYLKGNDLFATFYRFLMSSYKILVKKINGINVPVWVLLLILLAAVIVILLLISRANKNKKRKRVVRYRLVRQPR